MKINVEINYEATGTKKILKAEFKYTDTVGDIKNKIPDINAYTRLYYCGQILDDRKKLSDYNIQEGSYTSSSPEA
ncbi:12009_t:CDS:2 [Diversispora eburnea]|uniref:12009_t:CDS:1 n=1 Tax=Diversispora eburnea TaxID=1213867 RepID=A0A9N8YRP8_9GLOM|nr:12009_t:CDS:2 [Diversispora eburnea]